MKLRHAFPLTLVMALAPASAMACSACGCNLDTDEQSVSNTANSGWSVDERIDYVNQNHMMLGGHTAPRQDPTQTEVQNNTTTTFYTTTLDYQSEDAWGVNLAIPAQYRTHSTSNDGTDWNFSKSSWNALGDIRVQGRYDISGDRSWNLVTGLKLPTGDTKEYFKSGTTDQIVDRGLQPGTGTYDLLLGMSQNGKFTDKLSWFALEMWQRPLNEHDGFAEGQKLNASVGVRYAVDETFTPQFQINAQNRWRDRGENADIPNSGGEVVYASPGLFVNLGESTAVYGFIQLPVYQRVGGLELVPDYSASIGIKHHF
ncbi:MAG TPA: hypothetical protein VM661_02965 [Candidatus Sulfotelmatobacter sp.]|jgi:hypothetical protein|nr:hypothetical protein [Candidatus Sulfotelmatobacter sp.]